MSLLNNSPMVLTFLAGSYPTNVQGQVISFGEVVLKSAIVSVTQAKIISRTKIYGRSGTVKEYICDDDYNIRISGVITGPNGVTPQADIDALMEVLKAPIALDIVCPYLNTKGITQAVVDSYDLPQVEGGISYQNYVINLISDYDHLLIVS